MIRDLVLDLPLILHFRGHQSPLTIPAAEPTRRDYRTYPCAKRRPGQGDTVRTKGAAGRRHLVVLTPHRPTYVEDLPGAMPEEAPPLTGSRARWPTQQNVGRKAA